MDYLRKFARGAFRSGAFVAGLLGMYLAYKKRVPDYMGFISCCVSLYALTVSMIENEETDDTEKENESCGMQNDIIDYIELATQIPKSTCTAESLCYADGSDVEKAAFLKDFKEETNRVLENIEKLGSETDESTSVEEIFLNSSHFDNTPEDVLRLLNKVSHKLGKIKAKEDGIVIDITPLMLEKLDLKLRYPVADYSETALAQYVKDMMHELRLGDISAKHAEKTD